MDPRLPTKVGITMKILIKSNKIIVKTYEQVNEGIVQVHELNS